MLPHGPFETDSTCVYRRDRHSLAAGAPGRQREHFSVMFRGYTMQVRCAHLAVSQLIDRIDSAFGPREAIIIIHGDHGLRFTEPAYTDQMAGFSPEDFSAGFSTLLAVRHPGSHGITHSEPVPVQDFIRAFADSFTVAPLRDWGDFVYFVDRKLPDSRTRRTLRPEEMPWTRPRASSH
jgi:hypothetical protein